MSAFPQPRRNDGGAPCGECRLPVGEVCDICGACEAFPDPSACLTNPGGIIGAANRGRVRNFLTTHIGATNRECAEALGLGVMAVGRHVKALRKEWAK